MSDKLYRFVKYNPEDENTYPKKSGVYFVKIEKWNAGARLLFSKELGWMYDEKTSVLISDTPSQWLCEIEADQDECLEEIEGLIDDYTANKYGMTQLLEQIESQFYLIPKQ